MAKICKEAQNILEAKLLFIRLRPCIENSKHHAKDDNYFSTELRDNCSTVVLGEISIDEF